MKIVTEMLIMKRILVSSEIWENDNFSHEDRTEESLNNLFWKENPNSLKAAVSSPSNWNGEYSKELAQTSSSTMENNSFCWAFRSCLVSWLNSETWKRQNFQTRGALCTPQNFKSAPSNTNHFFPKCYFYTLGF